MSKKKEVKKYDYFKDYAYAVNEKYLKIENFQVKSYPLDGCDFDVELDDDNKAVALLINEEITTEGMVFLDIVLFSLFKYIYIFFLFRNGHPMISEFDFHIRSDAFASIVAEQEGITWEIPVKYDILNLIPYFAIIREQLLNNNYELPTSEIIICEKEDN